MNIMVTMKTFYAVKAMVFLARHGRPAYSYEIADTERIPRHFLEKILTDFSNAGLLGVTKGRKGGYFIIPPLGEINVARLLQLSQGSIISSPCVDQKMNRQCEECDHKAICGIAGAFSQVRDAAMGKLAATSLAMLVKNGKTIKTEVYATQDF